jgi:N-acetylglucosaminyldiphosphoundecaprenol N-acetyl-beta-D-mannosaminyltransferase
MQVWVRMQVKEGESRWGSGGLAPVARLSPGRAAPPVGPSRRLPSIRLQRVRIHAIDEQRSVEHILTELEAGRGGFVVTPNVDHLRRCGQDVSFSALVAEADLVVADGMPLVWASRLQGTPLPQRVAGSDLISSLSAAAAGQGRSVFLLGGDAGTAEAAAVVLRDRYPQLKIAGKFCPPKGFEKDEAEIQRLTSHLQSVNPDIVFVALGSPKQERLIDRVRRMMPKTWWLGVGVSFSFLCGDVRRAPVWMRNWGLEWAHRLMQEPKRLFRRYVVVGIPFASWLLLQSAMRGVANRLIAGRRDSDPGGDSKEALIAIDPGEYATARQNVDSMESVDDIALHLAKAEATAANHQEQNIQHEAAPGALPGHGRLRGLVLLGGGVRPTPLAAAIGRSLLDLPLGNGKSVLARWLDEAAEVARILNIDHLPVRLLVDGNAAEPRSVPAGHYRIERDKSEYRGTGGLLANIAVDYDDDDMILVGNAAQVLLDPLPSLWMSLYKTQGVVGVIGHREGEPSGLMLITCRALRLIPKTGFVDMKEQALPSIASKYDVSVLQCRRPTGLPIRSLSDYIAALRALHQPVRAAVTDPWAEDWKPTFAIIEAGAVVSSAARIHDSVVLAGASVEAGAVVVRSVISGTVRRDRKAVDQCVEGPALASAVRTFGFPVIAPEL